MAIKATNKLVPILAGAVIVVIVGLLAKSSNDKNVEPAAPPEIQVPDADSTNDTLRTLTAEITSLRDENAKIAKKYDSLETVVKKRKNIPDDNSSQKISELTNHYEQLLNEAVANNNNNNTSQPVGTGIDFDTKIAPPEAEWVEPANETAYYESLPDSKKTQMGIKDGQIPSLSSNVFGKTKDELSSTSVGDSVSKVANNISDIDKTDIEPVYTIPKNATLIGSTAMTALLGRVPVKGVVQDPYPVKILVGKDNLTANGLELPEVNHIVFSGTATGDWTLSCVRADLTSMTYVFEDGTIRTLSVGDKSLTKNNSSSSNSSSKRIAWISDERGIPCVTGKRISNATSNLLMNVLAQGVENGAQATADAEKTTTVSNLTGVTTENITGNALKNSGYETLTGGAKAVSEWLKERQSHQFDVIYVDTGANVAIHIDSELPIDYDHNGRKLNYGNYNQSHINDSLD